MQLDLWSIVMGLSCNCVQVHLAPFLVTWLPKCVNMKDPSGMGLVFIWLYTWLTEYPNVCKCSQAQGLKFWSFPLKKKREKNVLETGVSVADQIWLLITIGSIPNHPIGLGPRPIRPKRQTLDWQLIPFLPIYPQDPSTRKIANETNVGSFRLSYGPF